MGEIRRVEVVPVTAGGLFAAADAVGAFFEIPGVVDYPGKGGRIRSVEIIDRDAQALGITLDLFNAAPAGVADNAVYNPTDADANKGIGFVAFVAGDFLGGAANKRALKNVDIAFECPDTSRSLYGQLFTQGAPTYSVGGLTVVLHIEQEDKTPRDR